MLTSFVDGCYVGEQNGLFVSGALGFSWTDTTSYNSQGVWNNLAIAFEVYDLDICFGHSALGNYHRKLPSYTIALVVK